MNNLTGQLIRHVSSITHDAKVIVVGTAVDGAIYYSVKRTGFEDSALAPGSSRSASSHGGCCGSASRSRIRP